MRIRQFKVFPLLLITLFLVLQYRLWFQHGGIFDMMQMRRQLATEAHQNEFLKKRNDKLLQQVEELQNNNEAVESRARGELGMIKKGETFYQVVK